MALTDATLVLGADTRPLRRDIDAEINKTRVLNVKFGGGLGASGLGQISRDFQQFDKSLLSANARVLAFGASAGIVLGVQRAFSQLVKEMVSVDKTFRDINVILNLSNKNFTAFGAQLFDVARNTGQSFKSIGEGATELARQGLSATETLKRLKDAAVLARLSGLSLSDSVETITASINSFSKSLLDSTILVSKFAAVDAQFSVSSKDLAESIKRVGSASEDVGVDINKLLGLITAARQTTGREGPVIAQALNSVFSRIQRPEIIENLRSLGVEINNTQDGVQKLQALSRALDSANTDQAALIKFQAGGVRNLNILSAVLKDVNNEYGIYARAAQTAANATTESTQRNEELNKSFATLVNRTGVNLAQISQAFGKLTIGPALENVLGGLNSILEGAISKNSGSLGEVLGKGILSGLGQFLSGPGLLVIGAALTKLVATLVVESGQALKTVLGLNNAAKERADLELNVASILQRQPQLIQQAIASEEGLLSVVRQVNQALLTRSEEQASLSRAAIAVAAKVVVPTTQKTRNKAVGYIPEAEEKAGAYAAGYAPGQVKEMSIPQLGKVIYNTAEKVKNFPGLIQPAIIPPIASRAAAPYRQEFQKVHGFDPYKSGGLVPNYAKLIGSGSYGQFFDLERRFKGIQIGKKTFRRDVSAAEIADEFVMAKKLENVNINPLFNFPKTIGSLSTSIDKRRIGKEVMAGKTPLELFGGNYQDFLRDKRMQQAISPFQNLAHSELYDKYKIETSDFIDHSKNTILNEPAQNIITKLTEDPDKLNKLLSRMGSKSGLTEQIATALSKKGARLSVLDPALFQQLSNGLIPSFANTKDKFLSFLSSINPSYVNKFRGIQSQDQGLAKFIRQTSDLRGTEGQKSMGDILKKSMLQYTPSKYGLGSTSYFNLDSSPKEIRGQIGDLFGRFEQRSPNFANLSNSIAREISATGLSRSQIKVGSSSDLSSPNNPFGLGVYNTRDEPGGLSQGISRAFREKVNPKTYGVPNFALDPKTIQFEGLPSERVREQARDIYSELARAVEGGKSARDASKEFQTLSTRLGAIPKNINLVNQSFQKIQDTFRNLEKNKLLTNVEKIQKTGVLYPSPTQDPKLFASNVGGLKNVLAPQFAQLTKEAIQGERESQDRKREIEQQKRIENTKLEQSQREKERLNQTLIKNDPAYQAELRSQARRKELERKLAENRARLNPPRSGLSLAPYHYADPGELPLPAGSPISNIPFSPLYTPNPLRVINAPNYGNLIRPNSFGSSTPGFNTPEQVAARKAELDKENAEQEKQKAVRERYDRRFGFSNRVNRKFNELDNDIQSPKFQNKVLISSIALPIVAGILSESFGKATPTQRGLGQSATALGNIGSYGALGSQFGGLYGGIGGLVLGGALELPKAINAFTDALPDLEKEIDRLKEKINQTNDGFSQIIQTNEKLSQYARGELKLSPQQYSQLQIQTANQKGQLAGSNPKFASRIYSAATSEGNATILGEIQNKDQRELLLNVLESQRKTIAPTGSNRFFNNINNQFKNSFLNGPLTIPFGGTGGFINPSTGGASILHGLDLATLGLFSGGATSKYIEGNRPLDKNEQKQIKDLVSGTLSLTNDKGQTLESIIQKEYTQEFNSKDRNRDLSKTVAVQLNKAFSSGDTTKTIEELEKIAKDKRLQDFDLKSLIGFFGDYPGANKFAFAQKELLGRTSGDLTRRVAQVPEPDYQKIAVDNYKLIKSFNELDDELNNLSIRAQILSKTSIFNLGQKLERDVSNLQTASTIKISQTEGYNPFGAINIKRDTALSEIERARITGLKQASIDFAPNKTEDITDVIKNLNQSLFQRIGGRGRNASIIPRQHFESFLENIIPRYQSPFKREDINNPYGFPSLQNAQNLVSLSPSSRIITDPWEMFQIEQKQEKARTAKFPSLLDSTLFGKPFEGITPHLSTAVETIGNLDTKDRAQFFINIKKQYEQLNEDLQHPSKIPVGENREAIRDYVTQLKKYLDDQNKDKINLGAAQKNLNEKAKTQRVAAENTRRVDREQFIQNISNAYSDIVEDLGVVRKDAENIYDEINKQIKSGKISPRQAKRQGLAKFSGQEFQRARADYLQGNIDSTQYNTILQDNTQKQLSANGRLTGKELGLELESGFNYKQRDFFKQVAEDARSAGDIMKQSFSSAFQSFTDGSKSASEAARAFGISIATNILNKVADIGFNSLVGGLFSAGQSLFGSVGKTNTATTASGGGLISRFASGGVVRGGSGIIDDVPARLSQGSYVIKRSAVNKYGINNLNRLNFASGGGVDAKLLNEYRYTGNKENLQGEFAVDPNLSVIGQTDENNPQNALKFAREQDFYSYQKTIENYKLQKKQFERGQQQRLIGAYISAVSTVGGAYLGKIGEASNSALASSSQGGNYQSSVKLGDKAYKAGDYSTAQQFYSRANTQLNSSSYGPYNPITYQGKQYSRGGSVDNIPALLTGGEYVMNPNTVNRYGVDYMNRLNSGGIPSIRRYANGGLVGNDINSVNPIVQGNGNDLSQVTSALLELIKINQDIRSLQDGTKAKPNNVTNNVNDAKNTDNTVNSAPSVSITINMASNGQTSQSNSSSDTQGNPNGENLKAFADIMKNVAISAIIENQRPGGLLSSTRVQ